MEETSVKLPSTEVHVSDQSINKIGSFKAAIIEAIADEVFLLLNILVDGIRATCHATFKKKLQNRVCFEKF